MFSHIFAKEKNTDIAFQERSESEKKSDVFVNGALLAACLPSSGLSRPGGLPPLFPLVYDDGKGPG